MRISLPCTLFAALLAAFPLFSPDEARAQAAACTPTQTVSATADADGVYTTTLTCPDTSAAAGAADYRELFYNHGSAFGSNPADRDTNIANNNALNHLSITLGSGVVFTADGFIDHRLVDTDAAILLTRARAKTVVVEDGAVINLERTPAYWHPADADRPASATPQYDPAWYPTFNTALDGLTAIAAHSYTNEGDADVTIRHDGVINVDIDIGGTYGKPTSTNPYRTSGGRAIDVQVNDDVATSGGRAEIDVLVEMGATGVIRHVEGSDGLNGIYAHSESEDGDIRINLAEGSLIDVTEGGGYGVLALILRDTTYNDGARVGDLIVDAAGTIRTAVRNRVWGEQNGIGIVASSGSTGTGRVRVTSSGTIETSQGVALDVRAWSSANTLHDDPDTPGIEGHLVDVTGGKIETRGTTAIYASTGGVNSDMAVRVAEGAVVRAQALTDEDYANGAIPQRPGPDDPSYKWLSPSGNAYVTSTANRYYGWRQVDLNNDGTNDSLEPIITGIVVRSFSSAAPAEGVMDQVLVDGTVETIGGKTDVDSAIWMERGGRIVVGATGRVSADSGLAILAGCLPASEYRAANCETAADRNLDVAVAGMVEGDIRLLGDGDLMAAVSGTVTGDIRTMGAGALTLAVPEGGVVTGTVHDPVGPMTVAGSVGRLLYTNGGTVTVAPTGQITGISGAAEAIWSADGDLAVTVAGMVEGDIRTMGTGALTLAVPEGGVVTGTVHNPVGPLTVAGSVGRLLYTNGGTVTVAPTGQITGISGAAEAIRSEAGDLAVTVAGTVMGDILALGGGDHTVAVPVGGSVTGTVRLVGSTVTVGGTVGRITLDDGGGTVRVAPTGQVTGVADDSHGVSVGPGSTIENHGTIAGMVGIQAGAGSTVVNAGTVRSTEGTNGVAIAFQEDEANTLTLRRGNVIVGRIQGLGGPEDTVDLSDLDPAEVGTLTFVDETGTPVPLTLDRIRQPTRGVGRLVPVGASLVEVPTVFALADEVLSDLTGSIHAAVAASGAPGPESRAAAGYVFATPFGGMRDQDGDAGLADATHSYGGGLIGAGAGGAGTALQVGGFVGGSVGRLDVANRQDVDVSTIFVGAYARQTRGDVRLDARLLLGHMDHDSTRRLGRRVAEAEYTSTFISPEVGVATTLALADRLTATPRLRVRYAGLYTRGFREQTAGLDLQVAGRDVHTLEGRGAMGVLVPLGAGGRLEPRVGAEVRWLMSGEMVQLTAPGGSRRVSAGGDQVVGTGTVGVGVALPVAEALALVGNFDGAYTTERAWRATGYLGLTYTF